ncbi:MAG: hypothetical protein HGGPFJEG_01831 [Ignavibacteria bacterium]|nr:hypothetical protein [Ignavibacteria bacterium]
MELLKYIFFLTRIKNLGNVKIRNICSYYDLPEDFFKCKISDLKKIEGIDSVISGEILKSISDRDRIFRDYDKVREHSFKKGMAMTTIFNNDYPENLKNIFDAPVLLYYKGKLSEKDKYSISIVGTRSPTEFGKYNCEKFSEELSSLNIPLISGFARGIDTIVHRVSLKQGNLTYAVLGSGADVIYPFENRKLYYDMVEKGAVISEFEPGAKPDKVNFPRRNRIISGISVGTLVVESGIKGGALLTAEIAVDQNKEVFALPGYINSRQSEGTNELIKKGQAKLVTCTDDILVELQSKLNTVSNKKTEKVSDSVMESMNDSERKIFNALDYEPVHIDKINEITSLDISDCLVSLLSLEFKNLVKQLPGKNFIRS